MFCQPLATVPTVVAALFATALIAWTEPAAAQISPSVSWTAQQAPRFTGFASAFFPATLAAKAATSTIPIVFITGVDPVAAGLVASLARPGGNLTGLSNFNTRLVAKRFELLHQIVPGAATIAVLVNPKSPARQTIEAEARSAAQVLGLRMDVLVANTEDEIDSAFGTAVQRGAGALLVGGDAYFNSRRAQFIALAARHRLPANFDSKKIAIDGA